MREAEHHVDGGASCIARRHRAAWSGRRPCLKGASACRTFEVGKQQRRFYYDRRQRREVFDELRAMASLALAETGLTDERAAGAAWRSAVETWLCREGLIAVSAGAKVLPYFP